MKKAKLENYVLIHAHLVINERKEYLDGYRENLKAMLDSIVVEEKDGTRHPLKRKEQPPVS